MARDDGDNLEYLTAVTKTWQAALDTPRRDRDADPGLYYALQSAISTNNVEEVLNFLRVMRLFAIRFQGSLTGVSSASTLSTAQRNAALKAMNAVTHAHNEIYECIVLLKEES